MNINEMLERIQYMPDAMVGYMLTVWFMKHPAEFEAAYLEASLKHGE